MDALFVCFRKIENFLIVTISLRNIALKFEPAETCVQGAEYLLGNRKNTRVGAGQL